MDGGVLAQSANRRASYSCGLGEEDVSSWDSAPKLFKLFRERIGEVILTIRSHWYLDDIIRNTYCKFLWKGERRYS